MSGIIEYSKIRYQYVLHSDHLYLFIFQLNRINDTWYMYIDMEYILYKLRQYFCHNQFQYSNLIKSNVQAISKDIMMKTSHTYSSNIDALLSI
jgi:hypothetical protein